MELASTQCPPDCQEDLDERAGRRKIERLTEELAQLRQENGRLTQESERLAQEYRSVCVRTMQAWLEAGWSPLVLLQTKEQESRELLEKTHPSCRSKIRSFLAEELARQLSRG